MSRRFARRASAVSRSLLTHVFPNVAAGSPRKRRLSFGYSLIDLAGLAFLGLGVQPPTADWGAMLSGRAAVAPDQRDRSDSPRDHDRARSVVAFNMLGDALTIDRSSAMIGDPLLRLDRREAPRCRIEGRWLRRARGCELRGRTGRDRRARRRVRQRQVDDRSHDHAPPAARCIVLGPDPPRGAEVPSRRQGAARERRRAVMAMIFQDPRAHIDPLYRNGAHLTEGLAAHRDLQRRRGGGRGAPVAGQRRDRRRRAGLPRLPERGLRRHAAARPDRRRADRRSRPADRGRADDGARRHDTGRDRGSARPPCARRAAGSSSSRTTSISRRPSRTESS